MCVGLSSDLGVVSDISAGGCRLMCKGWASLALGTVLYLTLTGEGVSAVVKARIVRHARVKMFLHDYGVEFIDLTADQRRFIGELSQVTAVKRLLSTVEEAAARAAV